MRGIFLSLLLSLFLTPVFARKGDPNYNGVVKDDKGELLIGATIVVDGDEGDGCITNNDGVFGNYDSCTLSSNKVKVSYVGYEVQTVELKPEGNEIVLKEETQDVQEVNIEGKTGACTKAGGEVKTRKDADGEDESYCACPNGKELEGDSCTVEQPTKEPEPAPAEEKPEPAKAEEKTSEEKPVENKKDNKRDEKALADKKKAYDDAKAKEQSTANKTLTALTTAATGIGGMELAMGLSQQKADKEADAEMENYIQTMRCTYGDGKQVKAGMEEIELPGGNDEQLMKLRGEYVALAADLKERKEALGMKPGIEAEEILDKATTGLYDDENIGITSGTYGSLYRAKFLGSEADQSKIDADKKAAKNRVIAGGVLAGAGVVGGIIGNSAINGKLGEAIKKMKENKNTGKETKKVLKEESEALEKLQNCMKKAGFQNPDKLSFDKLSATVFAVKNMNCSKDFEKLLNDKKPSDYNALDVFTDSDDATEVYEGMAKVLPASLIGKMIGYTLKDDASDSEIDRAKSVIKKSLETSKKKIEDAEKADAKESSSSESDNGSVLSGLSGVATGFIGSKLTGSKE